MDTRRIAIAVLATWLCFGMGIVEAAAGGDRASGVQTKSRIHADRIAGLLWIDGTAIPVDPEVLRELSAAARHVDRNPTDRGVLRGAARLSRRSLDTLEEVNAALSRAEDLDTLLRAIPCRESMVDVGFSGALYGARCKGSVATANYRCPVAIARLVRDAWGLRECLQRRGDGDGDGTGDDLDECPFDPAKVKPGWCGCGVPDTDDDGDGIIDCLGECLGDDGECPDDDNEVDECTLLQILNGTCHPL